MLVTSYICLYLMHMTYDQKTSGGGYENICIVVMSMCVLPASGKGVDQLATSAQVPVLVRLHCSHLIPRTCPRAPAHKHKQGRGLT